MRPKITVTVQNRQFVRTTLASLGKDIDWSHTSDWDLEIGEVWFINDEDRLDAMLETTFKKSFNPDDFYEVDPSDYVEEYLSPLIKAFSVDTHIEHLQEKINNGLIERQKLRRQNKELKDWIQTVIQREAMYSVKGHGSTLRPEEIRKAKKLLQ